MSGIGRTGRGGRAGRLVAAVALAALCGIPAVAQGRYYGDRDDRYDGVPYADRDVRNDRRDLNYDYARVDRLRADIARDEARLAEDRRFGRRRAVEADLRDLDRDQRALDALLRDINRDHRDTRHDRDRYYR